MFAPCLLSLQWLGLLALSPSLSTLKACRSSFSCSPQVTLSSFPLFLWFVTRLAYCLFPFHGDFWLFCPPKVSVHSLQSSAHFSGRIFFGQFHPLSWLQKYSAGNNPQLWTVSCFLGWVPSGDVHCVEYFPHSLLEHLLAVLNCSVMSNSVTSGTAARQAPLSVGVPQARILQWVAVPSFRGSFHPRDRTQVSPIAGGFFTVWATRKAQEHCSG